MGGGISLAFLVEVIVQGAGLEKPLGLASRTKALTRMLRMTSRIIRIAPSGGRTPFGRAAVFWELPLGMLPARHGAHQAMRRFDVTCNVPLG